MDEKESMDEVGSCPSEWFPMLEVKELSTSLLVANAGREAGEVRRRPVFQFFIASTISEQISWRYSIALHVDWGLAPQVGQDEQPRSLV